MFCPACKKALTEAVSRCSACGFATDTTKRVTEIAFNSVLPFSDIAKLIRADNWFDQPALSVQMSSIAQNAGYKPFKGRDAKALAEKNILVIVIILVVIVVAFFLFQLWKKTG